MFLFALGEVCPVANIAPLQQRVPGPSLSQGSLVPHLAIYLSNCVIQLPICLFKMDELLFSHLEKEEKSHAICDNMDLEAIMLNEVSQGKKIPFDLIYTIICGI